MKRWKKITLISLGSLVLLFFLGNLGLNLWLKYRLPNFIKNNSDYVIRYKSLKVALTSGNIYAGGISIDTKNPKDSSVIQFKGKVDSLKISRFDIWDILVHKRINSTDLLMINPDLDIALAKPKMNKGEDSSPSPAIFENVDIKNGNIQIFRYNRERFLSISDLQLHVAGLRLTEKSVKDKLPVVFDEYSIYGNRFYFRPSAIYELGAVHITTNSGQMKIEKFRLNPLVSYEDFMENYPDSQNLYSAEVDEIDFSGIELEKKRASLSEMKFINPRLSIYTTDKKTPKQEKKTFSFEINLQNVSMSNAKVQILRPDKSNMLFAEDLNLDVTNLAVDEKTAKGNIPFSYEKFLITGKNIMYISGGQEFKLGSFSVDHKSGDFRNVVIKPKSNVDDKMKMDFSLSQLKFSLNNWQLVNNKLQLDANELLIDKLDGYISTKTSKNKEKSNSLGIEFPLKLRKLAVRNSNFNFINDGNPLQINQLNAEVQNIELNAPNAEAKMPFKIGKYRISCKNFEQKSGIYNFKVGELMVADDALLVNRFSMVPTVTKRQFIKMNRYSTDLYTVSANQISMKGEWDMLSTHKFINASQLLVDGANVSIYESDELPNDPAEKYFFSKKLRDLKLPLFIRTSQIKNSFISFEENNEDNTGAGKLTFNTIDAQVYNINSAKFKEKPTMIKILMKSRFMGASPMVADWNFDTANLRDAFTISGNVTDLPASSLNAFIEPYLNVQATGKVTDLKFNFNGDRNVLNGTMGMEHKDLQVHILRKDRSNNKVLSAIANMFVRTNSQKFPQTVIVDNVVREKNASFFHLFWEGLREGLLKILISKNIEKTEKAVQVTGSTVKKTTKDIGKAAKDIGKTAKNVEKDIKNLTKPKNSLPQDKKSLWNKLFKKKEKAGN